MIEVSRAGRVLRVALDRPEKRNALSVEMCRAVAQTVEAAADDASVGAIVLAAKGPAFCAGMDLAELGSVETDEVDRAQEQLFTLGARTVKPIVAAVHGAALGGGTGLVANCHIVIASEAATFGLTEIRLAIWPFLIYRPMVEALGERRTMELALTGRILGAREAKEIGLVHDVVNDPGARAMDVAEMIAGYSPSAIRNGILFVQQIRGSGWERSTGIARGMRREVFESADFAEGVQAFREKRKPRWPSLE